MKKKIFKKIFIGLGPLIVMAGIYYGGIEYYLWKWESPHEPLPTGIEAYGEQKIWNEESKNLADQAHAELVNVFKEIQTTSVSSALAVDGEMVWSGTVGLADIENNTPATTTSLYRVGSVSKSLTTTALARMVEDGVIDLDADIHEYLPDYPVYDRPMTVRQIASHMAGVRHYGFDLTEFPPTDFYSDIHYDDVMDAIGHFQDDDLLFSPGMGFSYSTHGYTLLSAVMQGAADKPFLDIMQDMVFEPVGMNNTMPEDRQSSGRGLVKFYTAEGGLYGPTPVVDLSNKWAGGGFVSTATDLAKLGMALLGDNLLERQTRDAFMKPQPMFDGSENPQSYALGWRHHETINILGEDCPVDVIHHGGKSSGGAAFFLLVPDYDITVAALSNGVNDDTRLEIQLMTYRMAAMAIREKDPTKVNCGA